MDIEVLEGIFDANDTSSLFDALHCLNIYFIEAPSDFRINRRA
jgi:hypothetical protein